MLRSRFLQASAFVELQDIPLNPEKALTWSRGSQGLLPCCEKATRGGDLKVAGCCGPASYRCFRRTFTLLWSDAFFLCIFIAVIFFLWMSLSLFVAPEEIAAWYIFLSTIGGLLTSQQKYFHCIHNLRGQADELTSKMRFASEGVDAIFNDDGQCLRL